MARVHSMFGSNAGGRVCAMGDRNFGEYVYGSVDIIYADFVGFLRELT
jgi:hypothetical protein